MRRSLLVVIPVVAALALAACGSSGGSSDSGAPTAVPMVLTINGLAPVSTKLLDAYKQDNPDSPLTVKPWIANAAAFDKILTAKVPGVAIVPTGLVPASVASDASTLGNSQLVLAVPAKDPKVTDLAGYRATPAARRASCVVFVPPDCLNRVTQQLTSGQIDAAVLWRTGAQPPSGAKLIAIPKDQNLALDLSSVVLGDTSEAKSFAEFLKSDAAKKILTEQGLLP